jgi:hypothetical protein
MAYNVVHCLSLTLNKEKQMTHDRKLETFKFCFN